MLAFFQSTLIIFKYYAPLAREASARYVAWRNCVSIWLLCSFPRFRQVCIVQKRDSGTLYAMKYVSRSVCESRGALGGVIKEVELLSSLEHPFLVNLWFSFQGKCTTYAHTYSRTRADLHIRTHLCGTHIRIQMSAAELPVWWEVGATAADWQSKCKWTMCISFDARPFTCARFLPIWFALLLLSFFVLSSVYSHLSQMRKIYSWCATCWRAVI